ncbi:hypothetical protein [Chamaesiphon polymorphus]|uniref:hypothetical protein n=1 Tax=Chamaesiphon polymorphus TaxID=2107691 RepID=UPI0015E6DCC0|nr:hypothetical protein [Chamaesiphon polymorphus]
MRARLVSRRISDPNHAEVVLSCRTLTVGKPDRGAPLMQLYGRDTRPHCIAPSACVWVSDSRTPLFPDGLRAIETRQRTKQGVGRNQFVAKTENQTLNRQHH